MRFNEHAKPMLRMTAVLLGLAITAPFCAQTAAAADTAASAPAGVLQLGEIQTVAHVVKVDPATNSVTLRGQSGKAVTVAVDPAVANVSKLAPGDQVNILYKDALLLRADKVDTKGIRERVETTAATPTSDGVTATARSVQVVATVQKIDHKNRKVTLRGPTRTVVVNVPKDVPMGTLKVGDNVRADYVGATAVEVTRNGERVQ